MLTLIQRVSRVSVTVNCEKISEISKGLLIFVGAVKGDTDEDVQRLVSKITVLRIFEDENGKMNLSVKDVEGEVLVVSQFTLAANCKKGRRPSFDSAAPPEDAKRLCEFFAVEARKEGIKVAEGEFAAHMEVELVNNGPVTIWLDSKSL